MGDERWVNVQPPTVDEAQRWLREHGAAFRQDTTDSLLDGNDVALHWAAKVLAALDHIEVLSAEIDSLRATLAEKERRIGELTDLLSGYVTRRHMRHWQTGCECLGNASECCDTDCQCHALAALDQGGTANG